MPSRHNPDFVLKECLWLERKPAGKPDTRETGQVSLIFGPYWGGDPTRYMDELWLEDQP